jgi:hypothetical protein
MAYRCLSSHSGPYMAGARDDFLRCHHLVLLYLDAKLPLIGDDAVWLCCRLRPHTNNN